MTMEDAFKAWLEQGGAQSVKARNSRAYAVRTIERNLETLGVPFPDLDAAWKADRFASLYERLRQMQDDARDGGQDYRILMPHSENPRKRLSNSRRWLGQYGRFLDGEPPGSAKSNGRINRSALNQLRDRFLAACQDFRSFVDPGTGWAQEEKAYKVAASERVRTAVKEGKDDETLGKAVFEILKTAARDGPLVRWQTEDSIAKHHPELLAEFHAVIGRLTRSAHPAHQVLSQAFNALYDLRERGAASLTFGERINIVFSTLSMVRPGEAAPVKIMRINMAWESLRGGKLFVEATANMASDYRRFEDLFSELFDIMRDEWQWQPQDWLDLQGFLWIALDGTTTESLKEQVLPSPDTTEHKVKPTTP